MKVYSFGDNNAPSIMLFPEDYRARYKQHFANPIIHEQNLQHEELLACYPDQWVQLVKSIAEGKKFIHRKILICSRVLGM